MRRLLALLMLAAPVAAPAATGGPDAFGYAYIDSNEPGGPLFTWDDISTTGTVLPLSDDDAEMVNIPFVFPFYGNDIDTIMVNSNGGIELSSTRWTTYSNSCLPNGSSRRIYGHWDDLNPASGGDVRWGVVGGSSDLRLIVQWTGVPRYGTSSFQTFQIAMFQSGRVEFRYQAVTGQGSSATVGIQGSSSQFLEYKCNTAGETLDPNLLVRFEACDGLADVDGDGFNQCEDCNDFDAFTFPGAQDDCDGIDQDCSGVDGVDRDGDGYTICTRDCDESDPRKNPGAGEITCNGVDDDCDPYSLDNPDNDRDGFAACDDDCDDRDPTRFPGAVEVYCNTVDDDCNPNTSDDIDGDGDGYFRCSEDCDDFDSSVNPDGVEVQCNGKDDDCDFATPEAPDLDRDGNSICAGDCDDGNPAVNAIRAERYCNSIDDDCNPNTADAPDVDGDGVTLCDNDCDDRDANRSPALDEVLCNDLDDDCDRNTADDRDKDRDGFTFCGGDCNDDNGRLNPDEEELCDEIFDNDCDGEIDEGCEPEVVEPPTTSCSTVSAGSLGGWLALVGLVGLRRRRS